MHLRNCLKAKKHQLLWQNFSAELSGCEKNQGLIITIDDAGKRKKFCDDVNLLFVTWADKKINFSADKKTVKLSGSYVVGLERFILSQIKKNAEHNELVPVVRIPSML